MINCLVTNKKYAAIVAGFCGIKITDIVSISTDTSVHKKYPAVGDHTKIKKSHAERKNDDISSTIPTEICENSGLIHSTPTYTPDASSTYTSNSSYDSDTTDSDESDESDTPPSSSSHKKKQTRPPIPSLPTLLPHTASLDKKEQDTTQKSKSKYVYTVLQKLYVVEMNVFEQLKVTSNEGISYNTHEGMVQFGYLVFNSYAGHFHSLSQLISVVHDIEADDVCKNDTCFLSHIASLVAVQYCIDNIMCKTGNTKAVFTFQNLRLCQSYMNRGLLVRNVSEEFLIQFRKKVDSLRRQN